MLYNSRGSEGGQERGEGGKEGGGSQKVRQLRQ